MNIPLTFRARLPITTISESNTRQHWRERAKRAKAQRLEACFTIPKAACVLPAVVTLVRISPRELDDDNLRGALKAVRDGIADRFGVDDRNPGIEWRYGQARGRKEERAVDVTIEQCAPTGE